MRRGGGGKEGNEERGGGKEGNEEKVEVLLEECRGGIKKESRGNRTHP